MELTPSLQQFLDDQCTKYCDQIRLKKKPLLVTNVLNLPTKGLKISVSLSMRNDKECLALHYPSCGHQPDLIFLDIKRHKTRKQLVHTLVHELCHAKFKTTIHDAEFYKKIRLILKGQRY